MPAPTGRSLDHVSTQPAPSLARTAKRTGLGIILVLIGAMWFYAFVFAPREAVNRVNDREWAARSEERCAAVKQDRFALQDLTEMNPEDTAALRRKADIVERATDALETLVDDIAADRPTDAKGREIVPQWIDDYRKYLADRRLFIERLRTQTRRPDFNETEVGGVPVSERINKFARENDMRSCQTPYDLSV